MRGPWEQGWIGWGGGWSLRRRDLVKKEEPAVEQVLEEISAEASEGGGEHDKSAFKPSDVTREDMRKAETGEKGLQSGDAVSTSTEVED